MEAVLPFTLNPALAPVVTSPKCILTRFFLGSRSTGLFRSCRSAELSSLKTIRKRRRFSPFYCSSSKNTLLDKETFDVVIVGAGVIGLTIARQLLLESDLSVAVVDAEEPCYGATGAGQGYLWLTHKNPQSDIWELSVRSKRLWEMFVEGMQLDGMDPSQVLGWKKTGSLLIARTEAEMATLEKKVKLQLLAGLRAEFLSATDLLSMEPSLEGGSAIGAVFLPEDCQLDANRTVAYIEKGNKYYSSHGRYAQFFHNPVISLLRSVRTGEAEGVRTSKNVLHSKCALVIAAGAWSEPLMKCLLTNSDTVLDVPVKPRKGHLLILENFNQIKLNHGLMEVGYADHKIAKPLHSSFSGVSREEQTLPSISMTATTDFMGNLVLGSSRQFTGFSMEVEESIIDGILARAGLFLPALQEIPPLDFVGRKRIKIGLRPYSYDGKPLIGPIPGIPKAFLATGHEGEGLHMALGTAEIVGDMILGKTGRIDWAPYSVHGRC